MRNVYCLFDRVAGGWTGSLVVDRSDAPMIRLFHDLLADAKQGFLQHAGDYELLCVGKIADDGTLQALHEPVTVATGAQWLAAQTPTIAREA